MNHIYKVIWSRVKNSYVVVSEIAGTARKSGRVRVSKNTLAAVLAAFLLTGISVSPVSAVLDGVNTFVEPGNQNIKIGNDIDLRNNSTKNGAIAIGDHAQIDDYVMQEGSIAIGKNAFVENMWGTQDKIFRFGMHSTDPSRTDHLLPAGIAIGQNTYARSGSLMIGDHKYVGALGDTTVNSNTDDEKRKLSVLVGATTVGLNSYSAGAFATTTGAYSIMTNAYDGNTNQGSAAQNFGAVINGSFNSIESKTSGSSVSGIANAVVGTANRTYNANGTLVFGAGNEVTNSVDNIANPMSFLGINSPKELAEKLREDIRRNDSGGAVLAVGGGNKADYAYRSQLIGVGNTLTGTAAEKAAYNLLNGYKNTGTKAEHVSVIGSENTVENSKSQTVIGDSNKITDRNAGTVSGKQEERTKNVSDLVIGKGNDISGNDTYMKGYESLTVIGNNNKAVNPSSSIVIGDNQKLSAIKESVVIGSMTPEEKADSDIGQKHASVVVGYHAQSGTRDGGGMNVALGHGAKAYGWQETVTGIKSIVEAGSGYDGYLASVYGGLNTVASNKADQNDGMANTVVGTLNKTEGANGALVFGAGNSVTHSFGTAPTDEDGNSMNEHWSDAILGGGQKYAMGEGPLGHDELRKAMGLAMSTGGGSVVTMGNGNTSDYAVHSQIIGSGNILTGTANTPSINNTINGYGNAGRNVERMSMMGTGNNMSGSTADVVIGDYHHMDGGKNNVILGSMATEKKIVEKTYTMKDASGNVILEKKYKVTENVPIKSHTANISNAVMLGYNTDVEKDGGVAIGADSVASVDKGVAGYDPSTDTASADTSATWKATAAAVSIGKAATPTSAAVTRQITNVAAGTQDTDAVNVAQLKKVQAAAGAAKVHYYSAKSTKTGAGSNYDNDGAEAEDSIVLGISSSSKGVNSTVVGNNNKLTGDKNGRNNSIVAGQNLDVEGVHNAVFGTDYNNYDHKETKVFGEQNTVIGVGNLVGYTAEKDPNDPTKWIYTKSSSGSDQNVAVGMTNTANGGSVVVGTSSEAENLGVSFGHGNKVIGSNSGGGQRGLALGNYLTVKGEEAVAVGTNASATADWAIAMGKNSKAEKETAMAFGYDSHAKVAGGVALGSWSVVDTAAGVSGYDPSTKAASTDTSAAWKSTVGAVSVGDASKGITRQITGVAAGTQDTDAVNVAQLKAVNTKYDTKLSRGFIIKKGGEAVGETISLNGDTAPEITFDVAEANKGLTVDRDGKTIKYGIDGSKIDLNGNDTIPGWTLEVGVKPGIPTNTGSAEGNKKVIKPNDTVTLRADNGIRLKQENGVVDIGLKYMAVDTKWTNINDAAATNGGMAIGANSNADGETSVALGWGSNISASNYAAALSPFSSAVNSEYGLAMGTKAAVKTSPYGMAMGALSSVDDSEYGAAIGANSTIVNSNYGVAIGTSATVKDADNAVAIGVSSSAAVKNGVAIGAFSKADTAAGVSGYDPSTKAASTDTSAAWRSTVSAASVGDKTKGYTRQITGVAAGSEDTDAVNVAQLKKAVAGAADGNDTLVSGSNGLSLSGKTLSMSVKDTAGNEVKGSVDLSSVADGNDKLVSDNNALSLSGKTLSMRVKDTAGNEVKGSVDLSAIAGQIDTNTTYTMSGTQNADNTTTITLKGSDGKENKVTVATKDTRNTVKAGENVTLDTAANTFGGTEYTVNVKADGKVENGNTKIVSGNTVYHETHVKNDGNYVKKENSAGDNLTILDKQVGKNTTNITNLGNTINNLNGKLGTLDNRISKVGAGAAALAALHPLDFDPHDKWDIAAGFGNYRNASAAAVGLFYRPNERTMMSLGWTMGDDRNMINAGISVKLGRGDVYTRYSKVEMANQIKDLKEKNDKMQAENKEMRSELDELKAQVAALAAKK
ncbi:ESPR-type extended signal peptide-containing protein [Dialister invisus]|uniref:ESPR-type extended signal peptide-containing protein n=1 Tax=Dialister invisus TaxID=218538 RepID=UPI0026DC8230|nr:ESPR-type extended signal peptide-containing protein [Dialister invisus]